MRAAKTSEVIQALKRVRAEHGYTYQKILDMVSENGGNISMNTVRKVFSDGSEAMKIPFSQLPMCFYRSAARWRLMSRNWTPCVSSSN